MPAAASERCSGVYRYRSILLSSGQATIKEHIATWNPPVAKSVLVCGGWCEANPMRRECCISTSLLDSGSLHPTPSRSLLCASHHYIHGRVFGGPRLPFRWHPVESRVPSSTSCFEVWGGAVIMSVMLVMSEENPQWKRRHDLHVVESRQGGEGGVPVSDGST